MANRLIYIIIRLVSNLLITNRVPHVVITFSYLLLLQQKELLGSAKRRRQFLLLGGLCILAVVVIAAIVLAVVLVNRKSEDPDLEELKLEDIINGGLQPKRFDGTWVDDNSYYFSDTSNVRYLQHRNNLINLIHFRVILYFMMHQLKKIKQL